MKNLEYKKDGPMYCLCDTGFDEELIREEEIAICYSENSVLGATLLKHGDPDKVEAYYHLARQRYTDAGLKEEANALKMISSKDWDLELLNNCIQNVGYLTVFLKRNNINP